MTKMTSDDYQYLYGQLNTDKIPDHMMEKIMIGEDFTEDEELEILSIIEQDKMSIYYTIEESLYETAFKNIYNSLVMDSAVKKNHAVLFLGGQPGAGKSTFYNMDHNFANYIVIDGDQYRKFHPYYEEIVMHDNERMPELTQPFVNRVVEDLIAELSKEGYNLIIEGTLRDADIPVRTGKMLKEKGYSTELYVIACDACKSWESTISRAKLMKEIGEIPRIVPIEKYDFIVKNISGNLHHIEESGCMNKITVVNRNSEILWRTGKEHSVSASVILENTLNVPKWILNYEMYKNQYNTFVTDIKDEQKKYHMPQKRKGRR